MSVRIFFFFMSSLLFISCGGRLKQQATQKEVSETSSQLYPIVIDAEKKYPSEAIFVQDVATVRYVPLETTDRSLVHFSETKKHCRPVILDEGIFLETNDRVLHFSRSGRYEGSFGYLRHGPEEYIRLNQFCIDIKNSEVYIADGMSTNMLVYAFDGTFKRKFRVKYNGGGFEKFGDEALLIAKHCEAMDRLQYSPYDIISSKDGP